MLKGQLSGGSQAESDLQQQIHDLHKQVHDLGQALALQQLQNETLTQERAVYDTKLQEAQTLQATVSDLRQQVLCT